MDIRPIRRWVLTTLILGCLASSWAVVGAIPIGTSQSAAQLYEDGQAALSAQRYKAAAVSLDASYRLEPQPKTMFRLGLAYEGMGHPDKAVEAINAFLGFADSTADASDIAAARAALARLEGQFATFILSLQPASAELLLDGQVAQVADGELKVRVGTHRVSIRALDYEPYEQSIDVRPGRFELDIRLRPITEPPEVRISRLLAQGDAQLQAGVIGGAIASFDEAQRILATPRGAGSSGLANALAGNWAAAEAGIAAALQSPKDRWVRKHRRELRRNRRRATRALGTLVITADATLAGAAVAINGEAVGSLPLADGGRLRVAAGVVVVTAVLDGHEGFTFELELAAGSLRELPITMMALPAVVEEPTAPGALAGGAGPEAPPAAAAAVAGTLSPQVPATAAAVGADDAETADLAQDLDAKADTAVDAPGDEPEQARREDIEHVVQRFEPAEPDEEGEPATGLEMAINVGYQAALANGQAGSSGALAMRLFSFGVRPFWPISAGIQLINGSVDWWNDRTQVVAAVHPGFYLRGHSQRLRRVFAFDVWGGVAFQPVAMGVAAYEQAPFDPSQLDFSSLENMDATDVGADVLKGELGVRNVATVQYYSVPIELGVSFFVTKGLALELATALTFWVPTQQCFFDERDTVCYEDDLKSQTTLYIGAGLTFLP